MHGLAQSCIGGLCLCVAEMPSAIVMCETKLIAALQKLVAVPVSRSSNADGSTLCVLALHLVDFLSHSVVVLSTLKRESIDALYMMLLDISCSSEGEAGLPGIAAMAFQTMVTLFLQAEADATSRALFFKSVLRPKLSDALYHRFQPGSRASFIGQSSLDLLSRCALEQCAPGPSDEPSLLLSDSPNVSKLTWMIGDSTLLSLESYPFRWQRIVMRRPSGQLVWLAQLQNPSLSQLGFEGEGSQRERLLSALGSLHLPAELISHLEDVPEDTALENSGARSMSSDSFESIPGEMLTSMVVIPESARRPSRRTKVPPADTPSLSISTQALAFFSPVEDPSPLDAPQLPPGEGPFSGFTSHDFTSIDVTSSSPSATKMKVDVSLFYPPLPSYDNNPVVTGDAQGRSPSLLPSVDHQLDELGAVIHQGKLSLDAQLMLHASHDSTASPAADGTSPLQKNERAVVIQAAVVRSPEKRSTSKRTLIYSPREQQKPLETEAAPTSPSMFGPAPPVTPEKQVASIDRKEMMMKQHKRMSADSGLTVPTEEKSTGATLDPLGRWSLRHRSAERHGSPSGYNIGSSRVQQAFVSAPTTPQQQLTPTSGRRLSVGSSAHDETSLPPSLIFSQLQYGSGDSTDSGKQSPAEKDAQHRLLKGGEALDRAIAVLDRIFAVETHKIGVLYVADGQSKQEEILGNMSGSGSYNNFLRHLGSLVSLKEEHSHGIYTAGLDRHSRADGEYSVMWQDQVTQVMFHVATLMPSIVDTDPNFTNKKRHIGNDHVHIVWSDWENEYDIDTIPGQFNTVAIVIFPLDGDLYRVQVISKLTPIFNNLAGPVAPNKPVVVSAKALCNLVRWTALNYNNMCKIQAFHEKQRAYVSNAEERLRQIKTIAERFS
jgi:hypothetical protein